MSQNLFRNSDGSIRNILDNVEGIVFNENPLDFFIILARYKFGTRFIKKTNKVIDVGCGHGLGSVFLSKYANLIIGADQDKDLVNKNNSNYKEIKKFSKIHLDIIKKFGRFPYRNKVLKRENTKEENEYLNSTHYGFFNI